MLFNLLKGLTFRATVENLKLKNSWTRTPNTCTGIIADESEEEKNVYPVEKASLGFIIIIFIIPDYIR